MNKDIRPPLYSIACISAMAIAYEILLMRLFSIIQWHHYAYMIISLALLGYGISGAIIAIMQQRLLKYFVPAYLLNLYLFGLSAVVCFLVVQLIPFNPEEMLWDLRQLLWLSLAYLVLSLPFFFAANAVALAMIRYRDAIPRIYGIDLFGAGLGSLAVILLLFTALPFDTLYILGSGGLLITLLASWEMRAKQYRFSDWCKSKTTLSLFVMILATILLWSSYRPGLHLSPYKGLSQALQIEGTEVITQRSSPLGLITVVENKQIPFRHAPGLSLNASQEPAAQLGVFTDSDSMSVITRYPDASEKLAYLNQVTSALPYQLRRAQRVAILGGGTGSEVLQALMNKVPHIDVVELNPQLSRLVTGDYADYAGNIYRRPGVRLHTADARGFMTDSKMRFDLIQLAMLDSWGPSGSGLYTLHENYLFTVEAIQLYFQHLSSNAYLSLSRWVSLPPKDSLKQFATAMQALTAAGINDPATHLLMIRSWQTSTLLIKKEPVTATEISAAKRFCERNAFDLVYYPGIQADETNRYHRLQHNDFYTGTQALSGPQSEDFIAQYKFNLQPATDDRPYFFNFFKWSSLPEIWKLRGKGGLPLLEAGYLVLIAVLIQALLASLVLILLPNWLLARHKTSTPTPVSKTRLVVYFAALGLAFMFIEIAFIQRFILFLHHPVYAASGVLSSFLIFAGLGAAWSKREHSDQAIKRLALFAIVAIAVLGTFYLLLLNSLFTALMALPIWAKVPLTVVMIAPLAFCMGMPFPLGLARLTQLAPDYIPWAWGINGCASVVSAVAATLIAIHAGFSLVIMAAILCYLFAYAFFPASNRLSPSITR